MTEFCLRFFINFFENFGAVLEQDVSYSKTKLFNRAPFRLFAGTYFIVCMILSNAFKTTNINKMTAPEKLKYCDTIQQLVRDNFTIYSGVRRIKRYTNAIKNESISFQNIGVKMNANFYYLNEMPNFFLESEVRYIWYVSLYVEKENLEYVNRIANWVTRLPVYRVTVLI